MISDEKWVYTSWGYGKVLEQKLSQALVQLSWGGTGYLKLDSLKSSIPISVKIFALDRKTLNFDWDILQDFSKLFVLVHKELALPPTVQVRLFLVRGKVVNINSFDSPFSVKMKAETKLVGITKQCFTWDVVNKSPNIELLDDLLTVRKKEESEISYDSIFGGVEFNAGSHEWDIKMDFMIQYDEEEEVFIGVATKNFGLESSPLDGEFWGFMCVGCQKIGNRAHEDYGERITTGDVLKVKLEYKNTKATLSFMKNGVEFGSAFTDIPQKVFPVVTINYPKIQVSLGKIMGV
ncbi:hypothetical protein SteCoe_32762 [Stentor coeruleus]|uniref:B30.2/SPRY domain-containing protein n=1 Tax=Stentor coeruleus TaxID=5963 RepID=A0A1R2AYD8_9CILI|nr:hypothetical protein SteCoe_32762 [Stentor coeruleus]